MCIIKGVGEFDSPKKGGVGMTNTELFELKVKESGKKKGYLAKKCGLSNGGFRNCVINKAEWTASQIVVLCEELGITSLKEKDAIFFAKSGE